MPPAGTLAGGFGDGLAPLGAAPRDSTQQRKDRAKTERCHGRMVYSYSERRKFNTSCWLAAESWLKFDTTVEASEPLLACALMAVSRLLVRPSCRKKMRWPSPHSGAVRN